MIRVIAIPSPEAKTGREAPGTRGSSVWTAALFDA
jgi:hypothetical protein